MAPIAPRLVHPLVHRLVCNGIDYRVLEWPASGAASGTALLLHGFMDAGSTWDLVAPRLSAAGLRVLAPDLRGYGETGRIGAGGYYHFPDYVFDVADLVDEMLAGAPLFLVGHSMGGTVATLFAGTFPERVAKLAVLEGLGPPDNTFDVAPVRMRRWIDDVRAERARAGDDRAIPSRDDALRRLAVNHPNVDVEILRDRLGHLAREIPDGRLVWKHDPLHRTRSPMPFFAGMLIEMIRKISCPALFVDGGPSGYHPPDEEARLAAFTKLDRVTLDGAGHMMHWTRPAELAGALVAFWSA